MAWVGVWDGLAETDRDIREAETDTQKEREREREREKGGRVCWYRVCSVPLKDRRIR